MPNYNGRSLFNFLVIFAIMGAAIISWSDMMTVGWSWLERSGVVFTGCVLLLWASIFGGLWIKLYRCHFSAVPQGDKKVCFWWVGLGVLAALTALTLMAVWPGDVELRRIAWFGIILGLFDLIFCALWHWFSARQPMASFTH